MDPSDTSSMSDDESWLEMPPMRRDAACQTDAFPIVMPLALVLDDFRRSSSEAQAAAVHREIARQTSCSQSSLVHHRECHNRFSCSQIPVSHFTQSQTIDRTCMSNMCGAALHLDMTTLARVGHKPQPQGLECAASLARHKRNRASVNGHYVAARSLSWAVTGEPRGPLEAFLWRSLLRQFPLANIRRGGRGAGWCDGR